MVPLLKPALFFLDITLDAVQLAPHGLTLGLTMLAEPAYAVLFMSIIYKSSLEHFVFLILTQLKKIVGTLNILLSNHLMRAITYIDGR